MELAALNENLISSSWSDSKVATLLPTLSQALQKRVGLSTLPFSTDAAQRFLQLPLDRQQKIQATVEGALHLIAATEIEPEKSPEPSEHPEKNHVLMALQFFDLELRDDIWAKVHPDDIIEVYDASDIQIFRTFNFFKASSYSLLDLLTHEWFHLWERPKVILDGMLRLMERLHNEISSVEPAGIPRHILKEILEDKVNGISSRKSIQIDFNVVCPLYRVGGGRSGYIVTCRATVLGEGETVNNLFFV